ncbi:MAG: radical SAM protein [Defluviitaleaceae bacterium]|nr:radical SAM protein [Defluviitaleaceae bacterium]
MFENINIEEIDINITNKCNLFCNHCSFNSSYKDDSELPFEMVRKIIDWAHDNSVQDIHITGGEPTLHKNFDEIIAYAVSHFEDTRLITNGYDIDICLLERLKSYGLKNIMFSVDGTREFHNNIRGADDSFERVLDTVKKAVDFGFKVRVNAVAQVSNYLSIPKLLKQVDKMKIDVFSVFAYTPTGRNYKNKISSVLNAIEWIELYNLMKTASEECDCEVVIEKNFIYAEDGYSPSEEYKRGAGCHSLIINCDYLMILSNGDVYPCVIFTDKDCAYGNIYEKSLNEILSNPMNMDIYRNFENKNHACSSCFQYSKCRGGCRAFAFAVDNNWGKKDPRCQDPNIFFPVCLMLKENIHTLKKDGRSDNVYYGKNSHEKGVPC